MTYTANYQEWGETREHYLMRRYPTAQAVKSEIQRIQPNKKHHRAWAQNGNVESRESWRRIVSYEKELKAILAIYTNK